MNDLGRKLDPGNVVILELLRLCYCLRLIKCHFFSQFSISSEGG